MKLNSKQLKKLKISLALIGTGSKSKLASEIGCANCQITNLLNTGFIPDKFKDKIKKYV